MSERLSILTQISIVRWRNNEIEFDLVDLLDGSDADGSEMYSRSERLSVLVNLHFTTSGSKVTFKGNI